MYLALLCYAGKMYFVYSKEPLTGIRADWIHVYELAAAVRVNESGRGIPGLAKTLPYRWLYLVPQMVGVILAGCLYWHVIFFSIIVIIGLLFLYCYLVLSVLFYINDAISNECG